MYKIVKPVLDYSVRSLCTKVYPGHPKGCPNYGRRDTCPPHAPMIEEILDLREVFYLIWNSYNLSDHVARMRSRHPGWSSRQLNCCLYWQQTARGELTNQIRIFLESQPLRVFEIIRCPEACGVNVTASMKSVGIDLEWPPVMRAYQVAIAGRKK